MFTLLRSRQDLWDGDVENMNLDHYNTWDDMSTERQTAAHFLG